MAKKTAVEVSLEEIAELYKEAKEEISMLESQVDDLEDDLDSANYELDDIRGNCREVVELREYFQEFGIPDNLSVGQLLAVKAAIAEALK